MKRSPHDAAIEQDMQAGKLSLDGFLGDDSRSLEAIIRDDRQVLSGYDLTAAQLGRAMRYLTRAGMEGLGDPIRVDGLYEVTIYEAKGWLGCPFKHNRRAAKRNTYVTRLADGQKMRWSDLNTHLIEDHGFFQGKNALYRIEPEQLIDFLQPILHQLRPEDGMETESSD